MFVIQIDLLFHLLPRGYEMVLEDYEMDCPPSHALCAHLTRGLRTDPGSVQLHCESLISIDPWAMVVCMNDQHNRNE